MKLLILSGLSAFLYESTQVLEEIYCTKACNSHYFQHIMRNFNLAVSIQHIPLLS